MNRNDADAGYVRILRTYQEEILRWNASINLVTRQSSEKAVSALCRQCEEALGLLLVDCGARLPVPGHLRYFDLGSGGGLPGVVWHLEMNRRGLSPRTTLVEPRSKRAWFLERVGVLEGMPPFEVVPGRWGSGSAAGKNPGGQEDEAALVLISLKALRLKDVDVLSGLRTVLGPERNPAARPARVIIARFFPPDQDFPGDLGRSLGLPELGQAAPGFFPWLAHQGSWLLGPTSGTSGTMATSLVLSEYTRAP